MRLYSAQSDATPILQACLAVNDVTTLTLAAEITEEGALQMDDAVCAAVRERLENALTSPDPAARRLAAEVKLSRRLKSFRRLNDDCEHDTSLVTCAEYQLFLVLHQAGFEG